MKSPSPAKSLTSTSTESTEISAQISLFENGTAHHPPNRDPTCNNLDESRAEMLSYLITTAAEKWEEKNDACLLSGKNCDDKVLVKNLSGVPLTAELIGGPLTAELIGESCRIAKPYVGKVKVEAFHESFEIYVTQVASGYQHGSAAGFVYRKIAGVTEPYEVRGNRYIDSAFDGMFGTAVISAPDVLVRSFADGAGNRTDDTADGIRFIGEVERGNRSLLGLIRHLGLLLSNFPNLNAVLGIKGEEISVGGNSHKVCALIMIEWGSNAAGVRNAQPHVTHLIDFGPDALPNNRKINANAALQLPLPPPGAQSIATGHGATGAGVGGALPGWTTHTNGIDNNTGNSFVFEVSQQLIMGGAFDINNNLINIPPTAVPAELDLGDIADKYF